MTQERSISFMTAYKRDALHVIRPLSHHSKSPDADADTDNTFIYLYHHWKKIEQGVPDRQIRLSESIEKLLNFMSFDKNSSG